MNEKKSVLDPKKEVKVGVVILNVDDVIKNEIKKFDEAVTEEKLVAAVEGYKNLKIMGVDDKSGYDAVHQARIVLKNMRVAVEQRRKDLKADFLRVGRAIDNKANDLIGIIEPTEKYLAAQEKAVDDEVERLKKEAKEKAERERRAKIEGRVARLREIGFTWGKDAFYDFDGDNPITMTEIEELSDDDFNAFHFKHKARYNEWLIAEEKRKAEEARVQAEQDAETRRLAEQLKIERERALAEQKKLEEEREKFRIEKAEVERQRKEIEEKERVLSKEKPYLPEANKAVAGQFTKEGIEEIQKPLNISKSPYFKLTLLPETVIEFIKENLSKAQYTNRTQDAEFNKIIENVNVLIEKTLTYFDKEVEKWQQSKK